MISNKLYDVLVKVQRFLPAVGVAYLGLAAIWGLPFGESINKTLAIIATLLGAFIEICIGVYNKQNAKLDAAAMDQIYAGLEVTEESNGNTEG